MSLLDLKILIVEDDPIQASILEYIIRKEGWNVDILREGNGVIEYLHHHHFDIMLLDILLPGKSGLEILSELRAAANTMPVIILSSQAEVKQRINGLERGADDYLVKPVDHRELIARVVNIIRRKDSPPGGILRYADIEIDIIKHTVARDGKSISLHENEFALLKYFISRPSEIITREQISVVIFGEEYDPRTNKIEVLISRLRKVLNIDFDRQYIITMAGSGYLFDFKI